MADNTLQTGSANIRADDRAGSGILTQVMLVDVGQEAEAELIGLGDSIEIAAISAGLTTATTAYVTGDQVGTEMSFLTAVRTGKGSVLNSAILLDKAKVLASVDLFLFDSASTPAADNAANSWSDPNILKLLGVVHFTDQIISANNHILLPTNLPLVLKPASGTTIFGNMVTRSGHTFFGAVTDVEVHLGLLRD